MQLEAAFLMTLKAAGEPDRARRFTNQREPRATVTPFGKRLDLRTRTVPLPDMRPGKAPVSDNRFPDLSADHGPLWIPLRHR